MGAGIPTTDSGFELGVASTESTTLSVTMAT